MVKLDKWPFGIYYNHKPIILELVMAKIPEQQPQGQVQFVPVAPTADAACIANVARRLAELFPDTAAQHGVNLFGGVEGGITDYRVGNNHGGARPEALNVVRSVLLALDPQQRTALYNNLNPQQSHHAGQLLGVEIVPDQQQQAEDANPGPGQG